MFDEKKIRECESRVRHYLSDRVIETKREAEFVEFFLEHSKNFLNSAQAELILSTDSKAREKLGFTEYNGLIVVINSSYYSMFNMARALLESEGIKIKTDKSIHAITFDAIVHFFYITKKLEKRLIESFAEARKESSELAGQEKAEELIVDLLHEKRKRGMFTYKMGSKLVEAKAKTSLKRAIHFSDSIKRILRR